ncbi:hypothetical protein BBK36DRAFT_1178683 [Trichoderma citrinoviride]|uniref:F-box domain-containing protein n=1 Tax=Trichoderma citrinoviride TaxID=58853 RepID=A0A2T4B4G8_9HYPO|nr:hypothetical protein BBK36DRAFT_1178683 [Trichoderma citrinoviride]PTB64224.1 hypothetical protein BBK36DRAFT_1178683 [Trichoderma citrinoviride]
MSLAASGVLLHLGLSSRHLSSLLQSVYTSMLTEENPKNARFSPEYRQCHRKDPKDQTAGTEDYDRALRILVKRRRAVQMARPFQLLEVSREAVHFTYANGAVCYTTKQTSPAHQHRLRILSLKGPSAKEVSTDIIQLIEASAIPDFEESRPYQFKPLYHAHGIVSCLYEQRKPPATGRWLIIYSMKDDKILSSHPLRSSSNIFVRNNDRYLYYGTMSELVEGQRRWLICGFNLAESKWLPRRFILRDLVGSDIGSAICFELFDDHLYGVSSQEVAELDDVEWGSPGSPLNSFYYAFQLPLGDDPTIRVLPRSALWRRGATDGPIDDRWNQLQLAQDEKTGQVSIFETRKEWLTSWSRRSCYRKQLFWPSFCENACTDGHPEDKHCNGWNAVPPKEMDVGNSVHYGDNGFCASTFDFRNSPVRSYNSSCQAFVDIVSTTTASSPAAKRLRLRVRSRPHEPCPTLESCEPPSSPNGVADAAKDLEDQHVRLWPVEQVQQDEHRSWSAELPWNQYVDELLNPKAYFDEIDSAMDESIIVYSPKTIYPPDEPRSIILVSFDPSLHFEGLRHVSSTPPSSTDGQLNKGDTPLSFPEGGQESTKSWQEMPRIRGLDLSRFPKRSERTTHATSASSPKSI